MAEQALLIDAGTGFQPQDWIVQDEAVLKQHVERLMEEPPSGVAFDTETTGLVFPRDNMVGLGLYWGEGEGLFLPFGFKAEGVKQLPYSALEVLRPIFTHPKIVKVAHNIKFDTKVLWKYGLSITGPRYCTYLAAFLANENQDLGLEDLAIKTYKLIPPTTPWKKASGTRFDEVDVNDCADYCLTDCMVTYALWAHTSADLAKEKLLGLLENLEMPLAEVLAAIEYRGFLLDMEMLETFRQRLVAARKEVEETFKRQARTPTINLGSPAQIGDYLEQRLGIKLTERATSKRGKRAMQGDELFEGIDQADGVTYKLKEDTRPRVNEAILDKVLEEHPHHSHIKLIVKYRELDKMLSTYVEGFAEQSQNGVVHADFMQAIARTGRLSCRNPNLQNVINSTEYPVRRVFIARPGHVLIVADYNQIELRITAHLSRDPNLMQAYYDNTDLHERTARQLFNIPPDEEVPKAIRSYAKSMNFGILYGMGPTKLSKSANISYDEALQYIARYFEIYAVAKQFRERVITFGKKNLYVETMLGRKRRFPNYPLMVENAAKARFSNNARTKVLERAVSNAENAMFNTVIQGSSGDVCKAAMVRMYPELRNMDAWLLAQIHDELIVETPENRVFDARRIITRCMERPFDQELNVPLVVNMKVAKNWEEGK